MEIHTPDHPPETWKETVKHLAMITAGVLIALAFEGAVARIDHRMLVREAKANLTAEIAANRKELEGLFANLEREEAQLEKVDELAAKLIEGGKLGKDEVDLSWHFGELKNAAVTTGQITGAFGYMDYGTVKRFADVYDLQAEFLRMQEREIPNFQAIYGFIPRLAGAKPPPAASIDAWRDRLTSLVAALQFQEQVGRTLARRYDELLK
ncbi:MAG TPA: hypothetical protein VN628_11840 [Vicinamibacterales bacterium]|nr:hypothetical protein [Vicinamibacterales bacterium]